MNSERVSAAGYSVPRMSLLTLAFCGALAVIAVGPLATAEDMSFIQEGKIKVGVDLDRGGAITFLQHADDGRNLVNNHDCGRQIQQSYYSGPRPFDPKDNMHPNWQNWCWNPIQVGDVYGNRATVTKHTNDGEQIYVETVPMHWALDNVPGDCTFESWIHIEDGAVAVRQRLNNARPESARYDAYTQELPAVYTVGTLHRLHTYTGQHPFEGKPLTQIENSGPPWTSWRAPENWAALVDKNDWGLGILNPDAVAFIGGFHGPPGRGGPTDNSTGYIAPTHREILDPDITYEYRYYLVPGSLKHIREWIYSHRPTTLPDYVFTSDRQHWHYRNAADTGLPAGGSLKVKLNAEDPQMIGPACAFRAGAVSRLHITAAYHLEDTGPEQLRARLMWKTQAGDGHEKPRYSKWHGTDFKVINDGNFNTYTVDLSGEPGWEGLIARLRFDPVPAGENGDYVEVRSISHRSATADPDSTGE